MDAGLVVGYLVSYLSGKAKSLADDALDALLERLYAKASRALVASDGLVRLQADPASGPAQKAVADELAKLGESNGALVREMEEVVAQLDRIGAQRMLVSGTVQGQVFQNVSAGQGGIVGSRINGGAHIHQESPFPSPEMVRDQLKVLPKPGPLAKAYLLACGLLIAGGLLAAVFAIIGFAADPRQGFPTSLKLGFGSFFLGVILLSVGLVGGFVRMGNRLRRGQ